MKSKKIITIILTIILTFTIAESNVMAKIEPAYTCHYYKVVNENSIMQDKYGKDLLVDITVNKGTTKAKKITNVRFTSKQGNVSSNVDFTMNNDYVENFINDADTGFDFSINKWVDVDKIDFENPKCPKYYYNIGGSNFVSNSSSYYSQINTKNNTKQNNFILMLALLENTDEEGHIESYEQKTDDTSKICNESRLSESEKKEYSSVCIYINQENNKIIKLYINDNNTLIVTDHGNYNSKDYKTTTIYDESFLNKLPDEIKEILGSVTNEIGDGNSISGRTLCPQKIYYEKFTTKAIFLKREVGGGRYGTSKMPENFFENITNTINNTIIEIIEKATGGKITGISLLNKETEEVFTLMEKGKRNPTSCSEQKIEKKEIVKKTITCDDIITKDLKDEINTILTYVRIIVPILIIALGMYDFGTAMLSSKEEEMKKAQARFTKRLIIGVAIFLLPHLINLLLDIINLAWKNGTFSNSNCGIN